MVRKWFIFIKWGFSFLLFFFFLQGEKKEKFSSILGLNSNTYWCKSRAKCTFPLSSYNIKLHTRWQKKTIEWKRKLKSRFFYLGYIIYYIIYIRVYILNTRCIKWNVHVRVKWTVFKIKRNFFPKAREKQQRKETNERKRIT